MARCGPLLAKYPFSPKAQAQATLAEIDSIFEPKKGELWAFYDANLQKLVQRANFQFAPASSGGMTVNPAFLAMLNRAGAFHRRCIPERGHRPAIHLHREAGDEPRPGQR